MTDDNQDTVDYVAAGLPGGDEEFADELPPRPRQKLLTPWSALLAAILLGAIGFYVGIRVEKSKVGSGGTSSFAAAASKAGGRTGSFAGFTGTGKAGSASSSKFKAAGGFAGAPGAAAAGTSGEVSSIKGNTLYVTESNGNTVKVKLSDATTITKSSTVSKGKVYPGDEVTITGKTSGGQVAATAVTDTGTSSSSSGSSSTSSSSTSSTGSSGSGSSAVSSLFGGS